MPMEFADKVVMLVDGESYRPVYCIGIDSFSRFHCSRHHLQRDCANGQGRGSQEGRFRILCASYPVSVVLLIVLPTC